MWIFRFQGMFALLLGLSSLFADSLTDPHKNPLPPEALAFPDFSENYRTRILGGDYEIWSEEKIERWCSAQGLAVTPDNNAAGLIYKRAAVIVSPGLTFNLTRPITEKGAALANGWTLNLDIAAISSTRTKYTNLLEADIFVDGVFLRKITQGANSKEKSPVQIQIPHIPSGEGKIQVDIKLANHPRNFLFLYDAYLSR
ncbi:MAG: hypothetical protein LDLANPLL_00722 [Turneriella sp.]|nr:hypothetical protein [Turneriella sp.]